jgi:demethylmenaquinone methyltransferase/2-methoxy-6-polyprenyl-1,4-benzoquinol methylase
VTLRTAIATPDGKRRYVRRLFATIANRYDFITGFLSYGQDRKWKRKLIDLANLQASDRVLDLACGTGDLLFAAIPPARSGVGLDVTHRMLQLAQRRRNDRTALVTADMLALPFGDGHFTVVTTGYGLRNVPDLDHALREIYRVLAPGGRLLSLDFNRPANPIVRVAYHTYLTVVGSLLGLTLHGDPDTYRYIPESIRNYPGAKAVAGLMTHFGFIDARVIPLLGGLMAIHVAKKPESTPESQLPTFNHSQSPTSRP